MAADDSEGEKTDTRTAEEASGGESVGSRGTQAGDNDTADRDSTSIRRPNLDWEYEEGRDAAVVTRGYPDNYDLNYVVLLRLSPDPDEESLDEIVSVATSNESLIEDIELEQPPGDLYRELKDTRIELQLDGSGIDNQVVQDKFRQLFLKTGFTSKLFDLLRDDEVENATSMLARELGENVFPGSQVNQEVRLFRWVSATETDIKQDYDQDEDLESLASNTDGSSQMLTIAPKIRPFLGVEIGRLQPGDVFQIRVVGNSARRLRSEFIDTASTDDTPYSKPLEARLISMEQGEVPQEIRFLVELAEDVYGIGEAPRDARVLHNEQLVRANEPPIFYTLRIILFACSIFLFATLILLFVVL